MESACPLEPYSKRLKTNSIAAYLPNFNLISTATQCINQYSSQRHDTTLILLKQPKKFMQNKLISMRRMTNSGCGLDCSK